MRNKTFFFLFVAVIGAVAFGAAGQAMAQSIARALQAGPAYLCPKASCPQVSRGAPRAGSGVAVFEIAGGFARISGYMDAAAARAKYGVTQPVQSGAPVALWVPVERLVLAPSVSKKMETEKQAEEERLKREAEKKKAAERKRRQKLAEEKRKAEEARKKAEAAKASAKKPKESKPASDSKKADATNKPNADTKQADQEPSESAATGPRETETAAKPASGTEAAKSAVPKPAAPKRLTAKLQDKRLSVLPSKAGPTLSMADVVAIRQKGLELLEAGECENLKAGGLASTAGFLFVQCGGISMGSGFTQFPRPAQ